MNIMRTQNLGNLQTLLRLPLGAFMSLGCLLSLGCGSASLPTRTNPPAVGNQLGLDYDAAPSRFGTDDTEFARTHATWLRAFYDVPMSVAAANSCDVKDDVNLNELKMIHQTYGDKYKIIFSLKYNATSASAPPTPTSGPQYDALVSCTNTILDYMYNSVDILVSGNEPFEPAVFSDMSVATFYQQITDNDIAYRAKQAKSIPIFVGSFNNLQDSYAQTPAATALPHLREQQSRRRRRRSPFARRVLQWRQRSGERSL